MGTYRLTVVGNTFKDLRCQLQAAIDEIEGEDEETEGDYGQQLLPLDTSLNTLKQLAHPIPTIAEVLHRANDVPVIPSFEQVVENAIIQQNASQPTPTSDCRGVKWDARVHSSTKELTDKGVWRRRRGITPQQLHEVESQQTTVAPVIPQPAVPPMPTALEVAYQSPVFQVGQPVPEEAKPFLAPVVEKTYENIPMPGVTNRKQAHDINSFKQTLIPSLAKLINDRKIDQAYVDSLNKHFGVDQLWKVNDVQLAEIFKTFVDSGLITDVSRH